MVGYVLVFQLLLSGSVAFYSGDAANRQAGRPTIFETKEACEAVRAPQLEKMLAARKANPLLGEFTLQCISLESVSLPLK